MKAVLFFRLFLLIIGISIVSLGGANYYFDYYGVFRGDRENIVRRIEINDRFIKMKYLLAGNHQKYDSYILGSSRAMKADAYVINERTYNLSVPSAMPEDWLQQLQLLIDHGAKIRRVYIGLDDISYRRDYSWVKTSAYGFIYQDKFTKDVYAYSYYLFRPSILKKAWKTKDVVSNACTMLGTSGAFIIPQSVETDIEKNPRMYVKEKKFTEPYQEGFSTNDFRVCIENIKKIKRLCDKSKIECIVFFNPQHMTTYLADDMDLMNRFKKELAKISPFWDFSGVNYVTANNYFWYETSHPRAFICDKILDIVSGQHKITWVPDFGVYVTPDNVDAFCEKAVRDRAAYDPNHEQWVPSAEERAVMTKRMNYPW